MILKIFSARDNAVSAFLQPFFAPTVGAALRSFKDAVNDPKHQFHAHAADYSLWELGDFDDATGSIQPITAPTRVVGALDVLGLD